MEQYGPYCATSAMIVLPVMLLEAIQHCLFVLLPAVVLPAMQLCHGAAAWCAAAASHAALHLCCCLLWSCQPCSCATVLLPGVLLLPAMPL
eukprot:357725-Chlamydomonas_euryale.AAC.5